MQAFLESSKFIISFMILTIFIQMIFGTDVTTNFLWLVLFSMIILQSDKFIQMTKGAF